MSNVARNENETFAHYRQRQAELHEATKRALKPKMFHDSYHEGTYVNPSRAAIKTERKARKQDNKGTK